MECVTPFADHLGEKDIQTYLPRCRRTYQDASIVKILLAQQASNYCVNIIGDMLSLPMKTIVFLVYRIGQLTPTGRKLCY